MKCEEGPVYDRVMGICSKIPFFDIPRRSGDGGLRAFQINAVQYYTACTSCGMRVVDEPRNRTLRTLPTILLYDRKGRVGSTVMTG